MSDRDAGRHPDQETLNRYAEGGLPEADAAEVDRHVEACPRCRRETAEIRELLRRTDELPRGIRPPRDLWRGIEARIRDGEGRETEPLAFPGSGGRREDGRDVGERGGRGATGPGLREAGPWLAAAAAVLVAVTAGATMWLTGGPGGAPEARDTGVAVAPAADSARTASPVLVELERVEAGYRPMVDRLTAIVESRGDRLPPETRQVVERNLRVIDAAIAEAESALAENPASPDLVRALDRSYQRKIDLLRRSARLTAEM